MLWRQQPLKVVSLVAVASTWCGRVVSGASWWPSSASPPPVWPPPPSGRPGPPSAPGPTQAPLPPHERLAPQRQGRGWDWGGGGGPQTYTPPPPHPASPPSPGSGSILHCVSAQDSPISSVQQGNHVWPGVKSLLWIKSTQFLSTSSEITPYPENIFYFWQKYFVSPYSSNQNSKTHSLLSSTLHFVPI